MCFKNFFYLEVIWRENSALGKPTNGSSVYGNDYTNWSPDYATDGIVQKNDTEFFHSAFEQFPWIRIDLLEIAPISFIRVYNRKSLELKWKENSALGKPVEGSSIFGNNSADWDPSYATDGLVLNRCPKIFHSNFEPSPWIKVDLMNPLTISFIRVFNRPDVLGERFHDVAVEVTNNSDYIQRGFYKGPAATGETVDILCDYPTIARYVRLRITVGSGNSLHIQELEIYTI
uniref:Fucolectin tachylectin-4 pentraxin-1 domain-containing protein n=1 Tax=Magallana gigas TaxID=29159 RepID=A0A8W8LQ72_MAGGI